MSTAVAAQFAKSKSANSPEKPSEADLKYEKWKLDRDTSLLSLDNEELSFFAAWTGIHEEEELKRHIIDVQAKAYAIHPYPCIWTFGFTTIKISRLPYYAQFLELSRSRPGAILLDQGCCFGNDLRKAVGDGHPAENAIASDLHQEFWDLGHVLFKDTEETFSASFVPGDIFNPDHISPSSYSTLSTQPSTPTPALRTLTSLNPLKGRVSAIHCSAFFHLFSEPLQRTIAERFASLLSPEPGSMIFGAHVGLPEKGVRPSWRGSDMFCHSPESWKEMWVGEAGVFKEGEVKVEAVLRAMPRKRIPNKSADSAVSIATTELMFCITRL